MMNTTCANSKERGNGGFRPKLNRGMYKWLVKVLANELKKVLPRVVLKAHNTLWKEDKL